MANELEVNDVERPEDLETQQADPDLVEVQEIDQGGTKVKVVKLDALHEAREENKKLKATIGQLQPLMPAFQEFLDSREQGNRPAPVVREPVRDNDGLTPEERDELTGVAQMMGFVNPETGEPDLRRTRAVVTYLDRRAGRLVDHRTGDVRTGLAEQAAERNRQAAYDRTFDDGYSVAEQQYIDAAFDSLPAEYVADPNVAGLAQLVAAGMQYLDLRRQQAGGTRQYQPRQAYTQNRQQPARIVARRREPMFTEGSHGRLQQDDDGGMSEFSLAAARARGKTPEQWRKQRDTVVGRRSDVLDDIY